MAYRKIKSYQLSEAEMRSIWVDEYCTQDIFTFDGIQVKFYTEMFDHCFYESANRLAKDKSVLSLNRLEKIYWIRGYHHRNIQATMKPPSEEPCYTVYLPPANCTA